eukprot:5332479-Amphidinium_carterae.1
MRATGCPKAAMPSSLYGSMYDYDMLRQQQFVAQDCLTLSAKPQDMWTSEATAGLAAAPLDVMAAQNQPAIPTVCNSVPMVGGLLSTFRTKRGPLIIIAACPKRRRFHPDMCRQVCLRNGT